MHAAIRRLRSLLLSRALALSILPIGALTPSPAPAYWTTVLQTGCNTSTDCPTVDAACQKWADRWRNGGYPSAAPAGVLPFDYNTLLCVIATVPGAWSIDAKCPTGQYVDASTLTGCRDYPNLEAKDFGQCRAEGPTPSAGNPVTIGIGNKWEVAVDIRTAGPDVLELVRHYNSKEYKVGLLGYGWRTTFDRRIIIGGAYEAQRPDGTYVQFLSSGPLAEFRDVDLRFAKVGSDYTITDREGTVETYNSAGWLVTIRKRNGYTQTIAYDASNFIESVTDSYGRQITFTTDSNGIIQSATGPDGKVVTYQFRNAFGSPSPYVLEKVVYPDDTPANPSDNPTVAYHYENPDFPYALTGITDERGIRYATFAYDSSRRATSSEHAGGVDRNTFTYNASGTITVTNALNKDTIYTFSTILHSKWATSIQGVASPNCAAANSSYTYNTRGRITSTTDWNGFITNRSVTPEGLETSRTEAFGTAQARTITTSWDIPKRVPTLISAPRKNTALTYDSDGLVQTITETDTTSHSVPYSTNGQTRVWTFTYTTTFGVKQLTSIDGPRTDVSDTTSYQYTAAGYLSRITNAVGHQINITSHDDMGRPLSITDANGVVTDLEYNARGWLTKSTVRHGTGDAVTIIEYNLAGDVTKVTLPDGSFLTYTYDDARRLTVITNQIGEKIEFAYDLARNVTAQVTKDSGGTIKRTQTRAYDELSRLLRTIGAATQTTTFGYDNNSNLVSLTDPLNKTTGFGFDALNRLITATNPLMGVRTTGYDGQDNVTSESDERSIATTYVYNGFGEVIQEASPDGGTIVYVRNSAGSVTQKTDARGQVSTSSYDALNRITATTFAGAPTFNITYGYDSTAGGNYGIGRLTSVTDVSGQTAIKYDHRGNVAREDRTIGGTLYTTEYKYDLADNLIEIVYPSGRILTYVRDALGRVTSVTTKANAAASPVNVATAITYMPFGPIASLLHGNALTATFTWDQDYRLSGLVTTQGGTTIQNLSYGYNLADNVTSVTDNLAAGRNQTFTLDDLQRLTSATGAYGSITYTYDAADNRLTRNLSGGPSETFTYGTTDNRLQSQAVTGQPLRSFTTNAAGDITLDDRGSGNTVSIAIGADARPETITVAGTGATTVTYKHNAFGERVSRVEGATTTHFHYDQDGRLLAESDGTGALVREYLWLGDKPLGLVVGPVASATLYFVHADHLERVQKITDAAQTIVWDGQFTPYGRTHAIAGTVQNPLRFPGQWADPAANYFYNYMRDYDPTLARYLSSDPAKRRNPDSHPDRQIQWGASVSAAITEASSQVLPRKREQTSTQIATLRDSLASRRSWSSFVYASANPLNRTDPRGSIDSPLGLPGIPGSHLERLMRPRAYCPIARETPDEDDNFCQSRWGAESARCSKWSSKGTWVVAACRERARYRFLLCFRNGGKPNPEEPPEWSEADLQ
jgi:RHS repeat-associated protein